MYQTIIFDADGVIVKKGEVFSKRFSKKYNIPIEDMLVFFQNEFQDCLIGKADLKTVLNVYLEKWQWKGTVSEALAFWFEEERTLDTRVVSAITELRKKGIRCVMTTNNEQYRVQYLWNDVGLKNILDGIYASCDFGAKKDETPFWGKLHIALGKPSTKNVFFVDDDQKNIDAALRFGYQAKFWRGYDDFKNTIG